MTLARLPTRLAAALLLALPLVWAAPAGAVTVFAAASLKPALDEIGAAWEEMTGTPLRVSLAGSSALARQIEAGAPADVFISANPGWMDTLEAAGLLAAGSRFDLAGNTLVLVARDPQADPVALDSRPDIPALLDGGRLAMAMVDAVPAGIYGKAALQSLGLWQDVAPHVAQADNVRAALALVALGEAPLGIVYATDAAAEPRVHVVARFPASSHPPIRYPAAALTGAPDPEGAVRFLRFLRGPQARAALERSGFAVLAPAADGAG